MATKRRRGKERNPAELERMRGIVGAYRSLYQKSHGDEWEHYYHSSRLMRAFEETLAELEAEQGAAGEGVVSDVDPRLQRILDEAIRPYPDAILAVWQERDVAVAFFEVAPEIRERTMRAFGWDGEPGVVGMSEPVAAAIAAGCEERGDHVTARWLTGKRIGRILVVAHRGGTLLFNHEVGKGYSIEPGQFDREWMS